MKAAPFTLHRPTTTSEAVNLLSTLDNARVLAGGQTLMPMLAMRYVFVDHLIDLNAIAGLGEITVRDGELCIGALVRQRDLELSPVAREHAPIVCETLELVGHVQTRNRGTFVGSICNLDPASEQPALASLFDATLVVLGPSGTRTIDFVDFSLGFMTTALAPDEIVTEVRLKLWNRPHGYAFEEFARRHGDFAIVGTGVMVALGAGGVVDRVAAVLCGVGGVPLRLALDAVLLGQRASDALIVAAAELAGRVDAIEDTSAKSGYRQHLARTLVERALRRAMTRAGATV
jgi:aerobic carbon-monoxide dehydrogenase medium subunit